MSSEDDLEMNHHVSQLAFGRRLRVRIFDAGTFSVSCGGCVDTFGDHALVCPCKGDRTVRHNVVRNLVFGKAAAAGLRPERERERELASCPNAPSATDCR